MGDSRHRPVTARRFDSAFVPTSVPWRGQVERVFPTAALVRGRNDGRLVTLVTPVAGLVPWGIEIPRNHPPPPEGATFVLRRRVAHLAGARLLLLGDGVDLGLARGPGTRRALRGHLTAVGIPARTREILEGGSGTKVADLMLRRASDGVHRLRRVFTSPAGDDLEAPVHDLVGLGPGSTPTGDDLLVGFAAAACRFAHLGWIPRARWRALADCLEALAPDSTTDVAQEMIRHSGRGAFPEALARFAELLGKRRARPVRVRGAARALAATGGTSGADLLAGALALARPLATNDGGRAR